MASRTVNTTRRSRSVAFAASGGGLMVSWRMTKGPLLGVLVALVVVAGVAFALPARAATLGDGDGAAIQALIAGQIAAFRANDSDAAYAMASPTIQQTFPSVAAFMDMVESGYMPVYRPQSFSFGTLEDSPLGPVQSVFVTGPDGDSYIATYLLQRQGDGSWKINGCSLRHDNAPAI